MCLIRRRRMRAEAGPCAGAEMKSIVKRWSGMGLLLFAALGFFAAQSWAEDQIQWAPDFRTACGMAAEQRRIVLLHFYNDNCGPCVRLEKNVFSRPDVGEAVAQNFVAVKVHAGRQPQLASRYSVNQWPTDVFVTPSGLEVYRSVSDQDPSKYITVLNQVAQQTGVGAARQWKSQLGQVSQNAAAAAERAAKASGTEAQHFAQQAGGEFQAAAGRAQQQWANAIQPPMAGAASQFQEAAGAARNVAQESTQQAVGTAQQFAGTAQQVAGTAQQAANTAQ